MTTSTEKFAISSKLNQYWRLRDQQKVESQKQFQINNHSWPLDKMTNLQVAIQTQDFRPTYF